MKRFVAIGEQERLAFGEQRQRLPTNLETRLEAEQAESELGECEPELKECKSECELALEKTEHERAQCQSALLLCQDALLSIARVPADDAAIVPTAAPSMVLASSVVLPQAPHEPGMEEAGNDDRSSGSGSSVISMLSESERSGSTKVSVRVYVEMVAEIEAKHAETEVRVDAGLVEQERLWEAVKAIGERTSGASPTNTPTRVPEVHASVGAAPPRSGVGAAGLGIGTRGKVVLQPEARSSVGAAPSSGVDTRAVSNAGAPSGLGVSVNTPPLVGKLVKYFSQCYGKTYIRLRKRWGNGGPFDWFAAD